jgi:CheY-like chemotaxis protein
VSIDDLIKLIDVVTKLLGVLVWPALLVSVLVRFGPALNNFFSSLGEWSLKGGGFEVTAKRMQAEAVAALVAASVARPDTATTPESAARNAKEAADVVAESVNPRVIRRASKATVLWVDDQLNNNIFERQSLEALGVSFVLATSTDEALDKLAKQKFDAIISDMGRPPDPRAGYTLLDQLRASGNQVPFIIYSSSNAPEHKTEARSHGAVGCTNRASELFGYVLTALNRGA